MRFSMATSLALCAALNVTGLAVTTTAQAATDPTFIAITKPAPATPILVVMPDVTLSLLTVGGSQEPKDEWSQSARKDLDNSLEAEIKSRNYTAISADVDSYEDPRAVQLLKLDDAVTQSIATNSLPLMKLPTKTKFDWTLGDSVSILQPLDAGDHPPAYALFVKAIGSYSSGGRAAAMVGMAMLGVAMPMGGQYIQGSLVDLKSGQIVWYQVMTVPPSTDIRTPEGAGTAVTKLLAKLPL